MLFSGTLEGSFATVANAATLRAPYSLEHPASAAGRVQRYASSAVQSPSQAAAVRELGLVRSYHSASSDGLSSLIC